MIGFWQSGVKRGTAIAVLSAALLGCSSAERLSSEAIVKTSTVTAVEEFTTKGKPIKPIETPWGPREIYDPAKDPLIVAEFKLWFDSGFELTPAPIWYEGTIIGDAKAIKGFDYLRHQCMSVTVGNQCAHFNYTFKAHCEADQNFHELDFSDCETENLIRLKTSHWGVPECRGEPSLTNSRSYQLRSSLEESLEDYFSMTCDVWRGENGDTYWQEDQIYPGEVPTRRFKQYRLKNEKPKQ